MGGGNEPDVLVRPIQNSMQYERVKGFFADVEKGKWDVAVGGTNLEGPGYFITPTIISKPPEDSRLVVEEPFGTLTDLALLLLTPLFQSTKVPLLSPP